MNYQQPQFLNQPCHPFPPPYTYENSEFVEEPESFIDAVSFSESDGYLGFPMVRSVPSHDLQELYIRKPVLSSAHMLTATPQRSRCCCNGHCVGPAEYVYELKPRPPPHMKVPHAPSGAPRRSSSAYPACANSTLANKTSVEPRIIQTANSFAHSPPFRSSPAIPICTEGKDKMIEFPQGTTNVKSAAIKRYPITYRTSRLMRRSVPPSSLKKLTSSEPFPRQPESKVQQQHSISQVAQEVIKCKSQEIKLLREITEDTLKCRTQPEMTSGYDIEGVKKMNSEGDTGCGTEGNDLDAIERIVATLDEKEVDEMSAERKNEIKELSKYLVPRVPCSLQAMKEKQSKEHSTGASVETSNLKINHEPEEVSSVTLKKSLNDILNQLENCELSLNAVRAKGLMDRKASETSENQALKEDSYEKEGIFNLKEISDKLSKSSYGQHEERVTEESTDLFSENLEETKEIQNTILDQTSKETSSTAVTNPDSKHSLVDPSALELHRSKSYIVNLIDRALSKELGTPTKKRSGKDQDLTPSKAIKHINESCKIGENIFGTLKKVCNQELECAAKPPGSTNSQSSMNDAEPTYIKQLKELRWGHFKHIQQEVKRLEDLERFLDTCGTSCDSTN